MRSRSSTVEAETVVVAYETAFVPGASGKPILIREGERRAADDPDVIASRGAWFVDGHRAEFVRDRNEHSEELAAAQAAAAAAAAAAVRPKGWDEYVECTEAFQTFEPHPVTREPVKRFIEVGDVLTRADSAVALFPKCFKSVDGPEG